MSEAEGESRFWAQVARLQAFLSKNRHTMLIALGLGIHTGCIGAGITLASAQMQTVTLFGVSLATVSTKNAGTILGCILYMLVFRKAASAFGKPATVVAPFLSVAIGTVLVAFSSVFGDALSAGIVCVGTFLFGLGYGPGIAVWLELCCCLSPRQIVLAVAASYCVNSLVSMLVRTIDPLVGLCFTPLLIALSALLFLLEYGGELSEKRPCRVRKSDWIPRYTLVWVSAFAFAHGIGTELVNFHTPSASIYPGIFVAGFLVTGACLIMRDRFDINTVYVIALPTMTVGLLATALLGSNSFVSKMPLNAALFSMYILLFVVVCYASQRRGASPIFEAALFVSIVNVFELVGRQTAVLAGGMGAVAPLIAVALLLIVVSISFLLQDSKNRISPLNIGDEASDDQPSVLLELGKNRGLTDRESTVFLLLSQGKSVTEISSELFIAQSTVRTHVSKICEKFGVHSRQELDSAIKETVASIRV